MGFMILSPLTPLDMALALERRASKASAVEVTQKDDGAYELTLPLPGIRPADLDACHPMVPMDARQRRQGPRLQPRISLTPFSRPR